MEAVGNRSVSFAIGLHRKRGEIFVSKKMKKEKGGCGGVTVGGKKKSCEGSLTNEYDPVLRESAGVPEGE